MYYLASGKLEIREIGKILEPGSLLGEIGIFARDQKRMATIVCTSDCELYELHAQKALQLYYQDRSFGLAVLRLIIARLTEDMHLVRIAPTEASEAV
jgi:CRP/FNR family cyclic AMP-dependent transcriptional regulator